MFDALMTDRVTIRLRDGRVFGDVAASVQAGKIFTQQTDIPIQPGDEIVRRTSAGLDEVFVVEDPGFHAAFHGMPSTYQMRVRRQDASGRSADTVSAIYNVSGSNTRFNINSVDSSINIINESPAELFRALEEAIRSKRLDEPQGQDLLVAASNLEKELGKPSFGGAYARFMALAASHMDVLGPFMPALTQLLMNKV